MPDEVTSENKDEGNPEDESRRDFLKIAATVSAGLAVVGIASVMKSVVIPALPGNTQTTTVGFPKVKVANVSDLAGGKVIFFNYPLDNEPNLLVKIGTRASGGVGPDGDIVAFSQVCQHLGCLYSYVPTGGAPSCKSSYSAPGPIGYCCCHGTVYDFVNGGTVLGGPSPRPQPQVTLEADSNGDIYAAGMGPPSVFGHNTGSNNVNDDLSGGTLVS